jgi:hypothetical protein
MIIAPKPNSIADNPIKDTARDTLRRGEQPVKVGSKYVKSPPIADVKEEKAKISPEQIAQSAIIRDTRQPRNNEQSDIFGSLSSVQIKGLSSHKTMFTKQEFANTRQEFSRAKYPLILVRQGVKDKSIARFLHGPEQAKSLGSIFSKTLEGQEIKIFMGDEAVSVFIPKRLLQDEISGSDAIEAILGAGGNTAYEEQPGANKCLLAALLHSGLLNVTNTKMAKLLRDSVPENIRHDALTCALYNCIGSGLPEIGQALLSWGANPNGIRPSDDFGMLQHAVVNKDVHSIKLLLEHGADPTKETESCISALDYANSSEFSDMKPYLIK